MSDSEARLPQAGEFWLAHPGDDYYFIGQVDNVDAHGYVWGHWRSVDHPRERDQWTWGWMNMPEMRVQVMTP